MPDSTQHHADMLRQAIVLGGAVEIHEAGCDSPNAVLAADLISMPLPDHVARNALRQARVRTLVGAADQSGDLSRIGQWAADEASLIIAAWARSFAELERKGGLVSYRGRP